MSYRNAAAACYLEAKPKGRFIWKPYKQKSGAGHDPPYTLRESYSAAVRLWNMIYDNKNIEPMHPADGEDAAG
jgi:hypothetical protein